MKHLVTLYLLSNLGNIYCLHTLYKYHMKHIFIWYTITLFVYIFFFFCFERVQVFLGFFLLAHVELKRLI